MSERPSLRALPSVAPPREDVRDVLGCAHAVVVLRTQAEHAWWECRDCAIPFAPTVRPVPAPENTGVDKPAGPPYITVSELANRIPYTEGTIRNLMSQGRLRLGVHYVKPNGRVMFKWLAVQAWLAGRKPEDS